MDLLQIPGKLHHLVVLRRIIATTIQVIVPAIPLIPPAVDVDASADLHITVPPAILDVQINPFREKLLPEPASRELRLELSVFRIHQALKERHLFCVVQLHHFPPPSSRPWPLTVRMPSSVVAVIRSRSATAMSFFMASSTVPPQTTSTEARRR